MPTYAKLRILMKIKLGNSFYPLLSKACRDRVDRFMFRHTHIHLIIYALYYLYSYKHTFEGVLCSCVCILLSEYQLEVEAEKIIFGKEDITYPIVFLPRAPVIRFWHWTILLSWSIVCSAKLQAFCKVKFLVLQKLFSNHIFPNSHHYLMAYHSSKWYLLLFFPLGSCIHQSFLIGHFTNESKAHELVTTWHYNCHWC